ncbi:MAG TPA: hypothetical protein VGI03_04125 [Verrucomicrobiae bacterium]|jgi:hypothetical protein
MLKTTKQSHWIIFLLTLIALLGFTSICQAQNPINISFDSGVPSQFYDASPNSGSGYITNYWQSTNGPDGSGCEVYIIDGTNNLEIDPAFNVSFNGAEYAQITFQVKVDPSSGVVGGSDSLLNEYGNLQLAAITSSYDWNTAYYNTIYQANADFWVTYTATVPAIQAAHLQIQLQIPGGFTNYTGPVKVYIGNISVLPPPNPDYLFGTNSTFNWNDYGVSGTWDSTADAPYFNPVSGAGPTSLAPAGSIEFQSGPPSPNYPGGQLNYSFNPQEYEYVGVDVYYDGPTPSTTNDYAGFSVSIAENLAPNYPWVYIGGANFTAAMIGHWTHFDFPCAASGVSSANGFAIQATPGSTGGHNPITFHMDNIQLWNPEVRPKILAFTPNSTPGGLQIAVDGDGSANEFDQEGITTPAVTNNAADFFWINQTPATYAFTLTNFPAPAAAPGFEAHAYVINGDSIINDTNEAGLGYQETYSGANYNALDCIVLQVENGTNGGVNVNFLWKTNTPNSNVTNGIFCNLTNLASANGAWALNFSDNTHASITLNGTAVTNFTLPDFASDPNYNANFTPPTPTSFVDFGVWKGDSNTNHPGMNDNQSAIFTSVLATNTTVAISDGFTGSSLTASNAWQIAEYYQYSANRTTLTPAGTAFWLTWNTTQAGFNVQSTTNLTSGTWTNAGVSFTYVDGTGTNTVGAIPSSTLPPGGADFFDLLK